MKAPNVIHQNENVRVVVRTASELRDDGLDDKGKYVGGKWGGLYLRAPDIFFRILEKAGDKLVRLGDIAEVRRGFTTGANEFFYLEPIALSVNEVAELGEQDPIAPVQVRNGAGWETTIEAAWLRPVIKSPREIKTLRVRLEDLRYLVFIPPQDVREAIEAGGPLPRERYPLAAAYIEWGERAVYVCKKRGCGYRGTDPVCPRHGSDSIERDALPERSTLASRPRWWDLGVRYFPNIVWVKSVHETHVQAYTPLNALVDQRLYEISYSDPEMLSAALNSAIFFISKEITSRINLAEGALDTAVYEANQTVVLQVANLRSADADRLKQLFFKLSNARLRSVFEDMGFEVCDEEACDNPEHPYEHVHPEELTLEQVQKASPDRFELDRVVFDVLELTDEERLEVYRAAAQLVKERLTKAQSNANGN